MSLFSRPTLESSHPSKSEESPSTSFSEAILDSAVRTRASLPEQYQETFDELRSGILAFCKEFQIPVESLSNTETFEAALRSKNILPKRMAEVVLLFQSLEYLIANKEPIKEDHTEALEYADRLFHLREQYAAQVSLLERTGILRDGAIMGADVKRYLIPSLEEIAERLYSSERRSMFETKQDQKFTKLLLVPFGMSIDILIILFREFLRDYKKSHPNFFGPEPKPPRRWDPLSISTGYKGADGGGHSEWVYFPESFDQENHGGKTKEEILSASKQGWRVLLLQAPADSDQGIRFIPKKGNGSIEGEEIPRPDLEAYGTFNLYLTILQKTKNDPTSSYYGESGMTPEDWMMAFMTHLEETEQPLDNLSTVKESGSCLVGVYAPDTRFIPAASWDNEFRHVELNGVESSDQWKTKWMGVRFVVEI